MSQFLPLIRHRLTAIAEQAAGAADALGDARFERDLRKTGET
jgi:hypothetical protein